MQTHALTPSFKKRYLLFSFLLTISFFLGWCWGRYLRPCLTSSYRKIAERQARNFSLEPELIQAIVLTESKGNPQSVSSKNAMGLMQLLPETAKELALKLKIPFHVPESLHDPETNLQLGTYYLSLLLRKFKGDLILALAAYNTGPYRVKNWEKRNKDISSADILLYHGSSETKHFVVKVLRLYALLHRESN